MKVANTNLLGCCGYALSSGSFLHAGVVHGTREEIDKFNALADEQDGMFNGIKGDRFEVTLLDGNVMAGYSICHDNKSELYKGPKTVAEKHLKFHANDNGGRWVVAGGKESPNDFASFVSTSEGDPHFQCIHQVAGFGTNQAAYKDRLNLALKAYKNNKKVIGAVFCGTDVYDWVKKEITNLEETCTILCKYIFQNHRYFQSERMHKLTAVFFIPKE